MLQLTLKPGLTNRLSNNPALIPQIVAQTRSEIVSLVLVGVP